MLCARGVLCGWKGVVVCGKFCVKVSVEGSGKGPYVGLNGCIDKRETVWFNERGNRLRRRICIRMCLSIVCSGGSEGFTEYFQILKAEQLSFSTSSQVRSSFNLSPPLSLLL